MSINSEHEEDQKESCSEIDEVSDEEGPAPVPPPASVVTPVPPRASVPAAETPPRQRKSETGIFDIDGFTPKCLKRGELEYQQRMRNTFETYVDLKCNGRDNVEIDDDEIPDIKKQIPLPDSNIALYIQNKKNISIEKYIERYLFMLKRDHNYFYHTQQREQRWQEQQRRQRRHRQQRRQRQLEQCEDEKQESDICTPGCQVSLHQLRF